MAENGLDAAGSARAFADRNAWFVKGITVGQAPAGADLKPRQDLPKASNAPLRGSFSIV
jgi:hypothetical protein